MTVFVLCISFALFLFPLGSHQHNLPQANPSSTNPYVHSEFKHSAHDLHRDQQQQAFHLEEHLYLDNGLLEVNSKARHPIYDLICGAEREWEHKMRKQSRTLKQAVLEYRRRYARPAPRGFDKWWAYVKRHRIQLPDERSTSTTECNPHDPWDVLFVSNSTTGTILMSKVNAKEEEVEIALKKANATLELIYGFGDHWMNEDGTRSNVMKEIVRATENWEMTINVHDEPVQLKDWELNDKKLRAAEYGEYIDAFTNPMSNRLGWAAACPPYSLFRGDNPRPPKLPLPDPSPKTFIYDHQKAMELPDGDASVVGLAFDTVRVRKTSFDVSDFR
ncbi:hypothetical protein DACRYDRAFT_109575 [Dacryopinax primogenitus]|uniref:Uncharacterized protein n=1 Tax=Dacryopinax primogenitus (strain DJM 731) TaxID=1858805 RepID=M5G0W8_DACPD|nr:uncharacterized protein DACRYDRAFT_109575 [Dacryopinax primogenitus]EJT99471.1 hypothetical protein DACRYDRAFT_109575 [Dacryopinax primogenitus]